MEAEPEPEPERIFIVIKSIGAANSLLEIDNVVLKVDNSGIFNDNFNGIIVETPDPENWIIFSESTTNHMPA